LALLSRLLLFVERVGHWLAGVAVWGITVTVAAQILLRAGFSSGITWTDELSRFLNIVVVFLGLALVAREGRHVQVTFLVEKLPPAVRNVVAALSLLLQLGVALLIVAGTLDLGAQLGHTRTVSLKMTLTQFFLPALIGVSLFALEVMLRIVNIFWSFEEPQRASTPQVSI